MVTVRALIKKEQEVFGWDGKVWGALDEAGELKPLNSDESLQVEVFVPPAEAASPTPGNAAFPPQWVRLPSSSEITPHP